MRIKPLAPGLTADPAGLHWPRMGAWYSIGVLLGLGTSFGVAAVGGLALWHWYEAVGGVVGAACGSFGAAPLVAGTLRRGGTRGGTAALLGAAGLIGAALAFVPILG